MSVEEDEPIHTATWNTLWCDHHQHLASERSCHYTEDPQNAPGNRTPTPVTVTMVVRPLVPDFSSAA